jgi:Asp/Glu/hydantoin racemase
MKIWYQSTSSYGFEPVFEKYGKTLEEQCRRIVRPDTEVHIEGIEVMIRDIENLKSLLYYQNIQSLNNMLKAEREGYDAFVMGCTLDVGVDQGKSMVGIPVVGISEASYHFAMMLGHLFAVVTSSSAFFEVFKRQIDKYGLTSKYLQGPYIYKASEEEMAIALEDPHPLLEKFKTVAKKAIADGASVVIPSPAFLATLAYKAGLIKIQDALILDTVSVAVKTAELLVDLKKIGIEPSRRIGVYAKPDESFQKEAFKKLEKVFKIES